MKRYRITLPTPEQCKSSGFKFEGLTLRTQLWLMGVVSGVSFVGGKDKFNLFLSGRNNFQVETNSAEIIQNVTDFLSAYDCTVEEILS